jgi:hypothetical protein
MFHLLFLRLENIFPVFSLYHTRIFKNGAFYLGGKAANMLTRLHKFLKHHLKCRIYYDYSHFTHTFFVPEYFVNCLGHKKDGCKHTEYAFGTHLNTEDSVIETVIIKWQRCCLFYQ